MIDNQKKIALLGIIADYTNKITMLQSELIIDLIKNDLIGDAYVEIKIHNADHKIISQITDRTLEDKERNRIWYCFKNKDENFTIHSNQVENQ